MASEEQKKAEYIRKATYYVSILPVLRESTIQEVLGNEDPSTNCCGGDYDAREEINEWKWGIENCFALLGLQMQKVSQMMKCTPGCRQSKEVRQDYPVVMFNHFEHLVQKARAWHTDMDELYSTVRAYHIQRYTNDWRTLERLHPRRERDARDRESMIAEELVELYSEGTDDVFLGWMLSMAAFPVNIAGYSWNANDSNCHLTNTGHHSPGTDRLIV
ncbi:MAG: hypothetical protein Q9222_000795 [Ikaeria aurantiellina]